MTFPVLQHFAASEFRHPDRMDAAYLQWLDKVRHATGVPFHLTSDARTPQENAAASGSSPTSLHLEGRAVDFGLDPWDRETVWDLAAAVVLTPTGVGKELELVDGNGAIPASNVTASVVAAIRQAPTDAAALAILRGLQSHDRHIHLGLFPDVRPSRLVLNLT